MNEGPYDTLFLCTLFHHTCPFSEYFFTCLVYCYNNFGVKIFKMLSYIWICWIWIDNFSIKYIIHTFLRFSHPAGVRFAR